MKKVIHIEDSFNWQNNVHMALTSSKSGIDAAVYGSIEGFRKANYPSADLYVCDRHLPDKLGLDPNDYSWKQILDTINCLHPNMKVPIVILSSKPPRDWRRYPNVVDAIQKTADYSDFDIRAFRDKIEFYLGSAGGSK